MKTLSRRLLAMSAMCLACPLAVHAQSSLKDLTLEELADLEVTSVSRRAERLADAPAAIYVITDEDIRRSGATSLAEVLRLAPNLHVARTDAVQYSISARGFNNAIANKLLVLVDGRTIYTPLFSGVFWDQQDVLLEDVERIEVISGPGATLWGANAVNGVINIITRPSQETLGPLMTFGGGNLEQLATFRYGGALGRRGAARVYGKVVRLENTLTASNSDVRDGREWWQAGFRTDFGDKDEGLTLQGDAYHGTSEDRGVVAGFPLDRVRLSGMNMLANYRKRLSGRSGLILTAYFDRYERDERVLFQPRAHIVDVELQHHVQWRRHRLLSGTGYRHGRDQVRDGILVGFRPTERALDWQNVFVQDEIDLGRGLQLSGGVKLERNDYTGWESLPSVRLAAKPAADHLLWGAVSRAIRAPARLDRDVISPFGTVLGGPAFQSEVADVFEVGYRGQTLPTLTSSATVFLQEWDRLRSGTAPPVVIENRIEGHVYGLETWATWQPARVFRLTGGLTTFRKRLRLETGSTDPVGIANPQLANDPSYQIVLRPSLTFRRGHEADVAVRRVAELPNPPVPAYTAMDLRYAWLARVDLELSVKVQSLFNGRHAEFGAASGRSAFERGLFVQARWSR
jgi:iron complex outermembrane receptor protein